MHDGVVVGVGVYLVRHVVPQVFSSTSYRYLPPKYLAQTARTLDEPYLRNVIPTGSYYIPYSQQTPGRRHPHLAISLLLRCL